MNFIVKRVFCKVCSRDLTDMGVNWPNHYFLNHPNFYAVDLREEYQILKGCK